MTERFSLHSLLHTKEGRSKVVISRVQKHLQEPSFWDLPGDPVVKTLCFQYKEHRLYPWSGKFTCFVIGDAGGEG